MTLNRKLEESFFKYLSAIVSVLIILVLIHIVYSIIAKGASALSWEVLTQEPKGGFYMGGGGGIFNAIVGSLYLAIGATVLAFIISLPVALFINIYLIKYPRTLIGIRFFLDVLWGVPSIVFGAFGFILLMYMGMRNSLGAGIVTVAALISPIMIRAMDEVLMTIPKGLQEAAYSLGSTKTETAFKIFFRQALPGFATAILLAFGRGIGDAASVLFTAGYTDHVPEKLSDPAATLPLSIFFQLSSPIEEVQNRAFAAAIVLTFIVLIISITARLLYRKK
ncbi:phosphate ABC transporter permease PstA [Ilyomonas limi]|uniref:Phosphate transport system permease protein PstA n=1 Tax=Ilyomonas limi TaxID=2575867 RepID=A0A4U3KX21_9BACT|nr:phosphate ABC transporter permease PstA [Ilyomonas limi]TKK67145.1 phosphate ABC transporter permease PstA [Ilyomonas limi]